MTVRLFFSNRLEALAERYAAMVDLENQVKENILTGPLTIVPNPNLMKWLQLTLAARRSVVMNVDFQYLEAGLWRLLSGIDPRGEGGPAMLTAEQVKLFLLDALLGPGGDHEDLAPLREYLLGPDRERGSGYGVRLWQLTERLAQLFESYECHRSDMIRRWLDPRHRATGMERCQQRLYRMMRDARDRYAQQAGERLLSLGEYADEVLGQSPGAPGPTRPPRWVHLFGLSQVSPFHLGLIGRLRDHYDFLIYSLNPCREFWEDIRTPQERRWVRRRSDRRLRISEEEQEAGELLEPEENELLALWGRSGREHIRLLCGLTDYDFEACYSPPEAPRSVLEAVQRHILTLSAEGDPRERLPQDRSLQVVACPGIYREVETIYNSILHNLEADPALQLTDIAVFVPDMGAYKPAIDSVFNRRPCRIPYNLVDSRADMESVYGQAVMAILDLARGRFSRREVFDLILNPCFMERWQIRFEDATRWAGWAEALGIFHSFDGADRTGRGYPAGDAYTWKQGLQRLRLSRVLIDPEEAAAEMGTAGDPEPFGGRLPFQDMYTSDVALMEKFSVAMEHLYRGTATLSRGQASGAEWADRLLRVLEDLLAVPAGLRGEAGVKGALAEGLGRLKRMHPMGQGLSGPHRETGALDLSVMREFVASCLGAISGGHGDYLTEGVTLSALQPMRPIPFRIVYVMGMEEGAFPGREEASSLDLRLSKRRIGDVSLPDRNRYLFLEMLLSVREKLYLTYVARDLQKDRIIQPSSLVNQLRRYLEREILPAGESFRITEIPLKGSSERYLARDAINDVSDVMVNYSLADRIACYRDQGLPLEETMIPGPLKDRFKGHFPSFFISVGRDERKTGTTERITVRQLRRFLEDPVSHYLKRHLGIGEEEDALGESLLREDEPFYSEFPVDYELKMTPLRLALERIAAGEAAAVDPSAVREIYQGVYEGFRLKGRTPEGAFGAVDKKALSEQVSGRAQALQPVLGEMVEAGAGRVFRAFRLGEFVGEAMSPGNRFSVLALEALRIPVVTRDDRGEEVPCDAEIHGELPWIWQDASGRWHVLVLSGSGKRPGRDPDRYILEPLLFWLCSLCTESGGRILGETEVTFHVAYRDKVKSWTYGIERDAAGTYLTRLASAYLNRQRPEWLPFEKVASSTLRPFLMGGYEIREGDRESFYAELREAYADETSVLVRLAEPHIPEDALDKAIDRFGIFFRHRTNSHDTLPEC